MWETATDHPAILQNTIHVWRVSLDVDADAIAKYRALLSADEVVKADKYYFERDRRKYTVARGMLRTLLARYLSANARDFVFAYGEHGKPSLAQNAELNFNISRPFQLVPSGKTTTPSPWFNVSSIFSPARGMSRRLFLST